jgi:tellurite resistance protein
MSAIENNTTHNRLQHMPISLFATVMGLAGLTIATQKAEHLWGLASSISNVLLMLSVLVYLTLLIAYGMKCLKHTSAVIHEFHHPIRLSFFPSTSIGLILLSIATIPFSVDIAVSMWAIGSAVQLGFTLVILSNWIHHDKFQVGHSNPAWFIPIVGNILIPIAGVELGYTEVSWFFYSIGLMMWLPMLAVLLNRFFFHPMMPSKLLPTLFILIAPPAVGFISWVKLHGGAIDDVARVLYYFALFTTLLMIAQVKYFSQVQFALPWWAYSFPMAAITIATMVMQEKVGGVFFDIAAPLFYLGLVVLLVTLVFKTTQAMLQGRICVAE